MAPIRFTTIAFKSTDNTTIGQKKAIYIFQKFIPVYITVSILTRLCDVCSLGAVGTSVCFCENFEGFCMLRIMGKSTMQSLSFLVRSVSLVTYSKTMVKSILNF